MTDEGDRGRRPPSGGVEISDGDEANGARSGAAPDAAGDEAPSGPRERVAPRRIDPGSRPSRLTPDRGVDASARSGRSTPGRGVDTSTRSGRSTPGRGVDTSSRSGRSTPGRGVDTSSRSARSAQSDRSTPGRGVDTSRRASTAPAGGDDETLRQRAQRVGRESMEAESAARFEGEGLLGHIYERPFDDEARRRFAVWLRERGDPQGEFILLQLTLAETRPDAVDDALAARVRTLAAVHGPRWLGPLTPLVAPGYRFERGMLAAFRLRGPHSTIEALLGHPAWATVRELDLRGADVDDELSLRLVRHPVMRSLRVVRGLPESALLAIARGPACGLVEIEARGPSRFDDDHRRVLGQATGFESLRRLHLEPTGYVAIGRHGPAHFRWLLASAPGRRLDRLGLTLAGPLAVAPWLRELNGGALHLPVLDLDDGSGLSLRLSRDGTGRASHLGARIDEVPHAPEAHAADPGEALLEALGAIRPADLTAVEVIDTRRDPPVELRRLLRRVLARDGDDIAPPLTLHAPDAARE